MTETSVTGQPWVHRVRSLAVIRALRKVSLPVHVVPACLRAFVVAPLGTARPREKPRIAFTEDIFQEFGGGTHVPKGHYTRYHFCSRVCPATIQCILLTFLTLRNVAAAIAINHKADATAAEAAPFSDSYSFPEQSISYTEFSENGRRLTLEEDQDSEVAQGTSLLQGDGLPPREPDGYIHFAVCDSGIYLKPLDTTEVTVAVPESRSCWQLCRFLEDKHYDLCESETSPEECFKEQFAADFTIPRSYRRACSFETPTQECPLFAKTEPDSDFCLQSGMEKWRRSRSWKGLLARKQVDCNYVKWEPTATGKALPSPYIDDSRSQWASVLRVGQFAEYYVVARDVDTLEEDQPDSALSEIESSIVPALYWDAKRRKGRWNVVARFTAPEQHGWFEKLTLNDDGINSAENICLFETSRGSGVDVKFGMSPGTEKCDGKIGVLRVAALSAFPATASVDRETGLNLCVARRWVKRTQTINGLSLSTVEVMQRVVLESNCASGVPAFNYDPWNTKIAGEWEQHFLALLYPLTRGISGVPDSANCPWDMSIQYGLKCFAAVEAASSAYLATFPESQIACRRLALNFGVPSNFSRLAVIQNDHDFRLLDFISPPASTAWIGFYQRIQVQLSVVTSEAEIVRAPESPCPDEILAPPGKSISRMSALKPLCEASGSLIDEPPWESTWPQYDGHLLSLKRWDIPWCVGHPRVIEDGRFVDCAALRKRTDGSSCVYSAPCDAVITSFCTFPVYYPPGITGQSTEQKVAHLSPRIQCTRAACVARFNLSGKESRGLVGDKVNLLGVPFADQAFVAIKSTCMSLTSMVGPYKVAEEVNFASVESFKKIKPGLYDICYCSSLPNSGRQRVSAYCKSSADYRQLVATLVLDDVQRLGGLEGALKVPNAILRPLSSSGLAIDTARSKMLAGTTVSCAWRATRPLEVCTFYLKSAAGVEASSPTGFTLHFIPLNEEVDNTNVCGGRFEARATGDVSVDAAVSVPLERPTAEFYAVCERSGDYVGSLFFPESVLLPKRPQTSMQLTFPSLSVKKPLVTLTFQDPNVDASARISYVVVLAAKGPEDVNCSWELLQGSEDKQEYRDATNVDDGSLRFTLKPLVGFGKICYVAEGTTGGEQGGTEYSGYADFLPPSSKMTPITTAASRCFAVPDETPCRIDAVPEHLTMHDNPHDLAPFFSPNLRLYAIPDGAGCPTSLTDPLYTDFAGDESDVSAVESASSLPLREISALGSSVTFELPQAFKPWLKKQRTALLCWLHSSYPVPSVCSSNCATAVGRLYWIEADTASEQSSEVFCGEDDAECLISVRGVNMNLFESASTRLAAFDNCEEHTQGIGTLSIFGVYYNDPLRGIPTLAFPAAREGGAPLATVGEETSLPNVGEDRQPDVFPHVNYMDFSSVTPAELSSTFNSTSINYKSTYKPVYNMQELCFAGAKTTSSDAVAQAYQKVGYLIFTRAILTAELTVTSNDNNAASLYEVAVRLKGSDTQPVQDRSVIYTKSATLGQPEPTICDYRTDLTKLIHESTPAEVKVVGISETQAVYKHPLPSQPVAFCWSLLFSGASGKRVVWQNSLLGYSLGPPFPIVEPHIPFCSLESISKGCRFAVAPAQESQTFSGGFFVEVPSSLLDTGVVVMLKDLSSSCPADPASNVFLARTHESYVLERISSSPSRQELSVPVEGLDFLARTGKAVLCYAIRDCTPASPNQQCTKDLGLLQWLGPVQQPADWLVVCERLELSGCLISIKGHGLDMLDYSTPLLAVKPTCSSSLVYQTGFFHGISSSGSQGNLAHESSETLPESGSSTIVEFAVPYMPSSVDALCWDVRRQMGGTNDSSKPEYAFYLGAILFLPFPLVEAKQWNVDAAKGATLHIRINLIIELSRMEQLVGPPLGERVDDHYLYQVVGDSTACRGPAVTTARLSFTHSTSRLLVAKSRIQAASPTSLSSGTTITDASTTILETVDLDYEVSQWADRTELCWRSVFHDASGRELYDYITHVDSVLAASPAELDDSAPNHPEPQLALCSQVDDPDDCTVTIKPKGASSVTSGFLPANSQVFLLRGDVACPTDVDDDILTVAKDGADGSIPDAAVAVKMIASETVQDGSVKFAYPVKNKRWVSTGGVVSICWAYGSKNSCPQTSEKPCVLKLGMMYWRGPRMSVTPMFVLCENASGCEMQVEGTNLHTLNHLYSRVALLKKCGQQGGLGLIEVTGFPEGYSPPESWIPAVNHFKPEGESGREPFFVYNDRTVELLCEEGATVVIIEASWQREGPESAKTCQALDVSTTVTNWCNGKRRCIVHPYLGDSEAPSGVTSASQLETLSFPDPCPTGEDLILSGMYTCTSYQGRDLALIEERVHINLPRDKFRGSWSSTIQHMTFVVPQGGSRTYRICWNPNKDLTLRPESYNVDLGVVQILPTAGISDIRKAPSSAIDDAVLEIYITSVLDEEIAKWTSIYFVPPSDGAECDKNNAQASSRVQSYVARSADISILMYTMTAPELEMVLCWNWMGEALVSATGVQQRNRLGTVPGSTNPQAHAWGDLVCGGNTDTVCHVSIRPALLEHSASPTDTPVQPEARAHSFLQNLEPFFQKHYSVYLLEDTGACPTDPLDARYTGASAETKSVKLSQSLSTAGEVIKVLGRLEKRWLAEHFDGRLCWVNDGACGSVGLKPCVADIGIVSWIGPVPLEWDVSPLRVRCKKGTRCRIAVSARNVFLMDLTTSRVAILETCGGSVGPGIATEESTKSHLLDITSNGNPSILQVDPATSGHMHNAASSVLYGALARTPSQTCSHDLGCELYGSVDDVALGMSKLEAEARVVPNLSRSEILVVATVLRETRNYLICWNPNARSSSDLSTFTVPIGEVEFYGFQMTKALCFSGSTCALSLSIVGTDMSDVEVALKDVDCSDLTLSTSLGDGILYPRPEKRFELAERIPEGPISLKTYHMCWCDKSYVKDCSATDYVDQVGVLDVRVMPYVDAICPLALNECTITLPFLLNEDNPFGRLFLVEDTRGTRDCLGEGNSSEPSFEVIDDRMQFTVNLAEPENENWESVPVNLICWMSGVEKSQTQSKAGEPLFSSTPALLGAITYAGALKLDHQGSNMVAFVGVPLHVQVAVAGLSRLVGKIIDPSMDESILPQQWRRVLVVPHGLCGQSEFVHRLQLTRVVPEGRFQIATFDDTVVLGLLPKGVEHLDVCWCTDKLGCSADVHYATKVAELDVVSPQEGVDVACTYDTKCTFEYKRVQDETKYGLDSRIIVADPGCTAASVALPGKGFLVRKTETIAMDDTDEATVQGDGARQREMQEFSSPLSRRAIFQRQRKTREFAICYCAVASSGCEPRDLVEVGRLVVHDVWVGVFTTNIIQPVDIRLLNPPFNGFNGKIYISEGDGHPALEAEVQKQSDEPQFLVDLSSVLDWEFIPSSVSVLYCESEDASYCSSQHAERVKVAEVNFQGCAEKNWVRWCHLGTRCQFDLKFFISDNAERIALLSSCSAPSPEHDYGVSDLGFGSTDGASVTTMTFEWSKALPDNGHSEYEACWCNGTTGCTSIYDYTIKIGEVKVTGLQRLQSRECHVGTVCTADNLKGYNLRQNLSLRLFGNLCGFEATVMDTFPRSGIFVPTNIQEMSASFTLEDTLQEVAPSTARLCECPKIDGQCISPEDYTWTVGTYSVLGPSHVTLDSEATTGVPLGFRLAYTGHLDLQRDFVKLDTDKDCSHSTPFDPPLPMNGWLPLTSSKSVDASRFPLSLRGNVYFVCYCRAQKSALPAEANNNPFYDENAVPDEGLCNVASAYKTLVGVLVVTGPHEVDREYICVAGGNCHVDVVTTFSGTALSYNQLSTSLVELKEVSCSDAVSAASARVEDWRSEREYSVNYENITIRTALQTFAFSSQLALTAGTYKVCWKSPTNSGHPFEIGLMHVTGPHRSDITLEVVSGKEFTLGVMYVGRGDGSELKESRIRLVPNTSDAVPPQLVTCAEQPWSVGLSAAFRYTNLLRPPDSVQQYDGSYQMALWDNVIIIIDANTPEFSPGALFAVCFCNGNTADCSLESSYFMQVASLQVTGPEATSISYSVQVGRPIRYAITGFRLPVENYIMVLPSTDPATHKAYSCGDADTENIFSVAMAVNTGADEPDKVYFKDVFISAPSQSVTVCWCGGMECSRGSQFRVEVGKIDVEFPEMDQVAIIPEGVFSIILRGSSVRFGDRITIVDPEKICGSEGTEKMDPLLVTLPSNSSNKRLDDLGKGQLIKDLPPQNGKSRWLWSSWPIQATAEATRSLKVCYCSGSEGACVGENRFNAWIGSVTVLGPVRDSLKFSVLPHFAQQIELRGNSLSLSNKLKYFVTHRSTDTPTADLRILCTHTPDAEATVAVPDWVDDDGVVQRFAVSMSPGYRYILCWSFGTVLEETSSETSEELQRTDVTSTSFLNARYELLPDAATASKQRGASFLHVAPDAETSTPATFSDTRLRWNFLADFTPTGFRSGQILTAVVSMEDQLVIRGSPNVTDTYTAYIGKEGRGRDCEELQRRPLLVLEEVTQITGQHIIFSLPAFHSTGLYPICILNVGVNRFFEVGTIKVEEYYWKSVYELFERSRLIMYPCWTTDSSSASGADGSKLYMPDGTGAWKADVGTVQTEEGTNIPILQFGKEKKDRWIDFYDQGLRSVVACATDEHQDTYFLGPSKFIIMVPPLVAGATSSGPNLYPREHDLPTPIDITVKYPYVFMADYQSPMILVLSAAVPDFRRRIFPTDPVLLFAAGIQVLDVGGKTLLAVADMINHIVGSVYVELDDKNSGEQDEIVSKPWHSFFGRPKVPLRNAQGMAYPFTLGRYIPMSSAAADASGQTSSLLMVGELVTQRVIFLEPHSSGLRFYRQILLPERLMVSGLQFIEDRLFVAARNWFKDVDVADSNAYISIMKLSDLVDSRYFTYPDFRTKFQSGIRYSFMPIVSGPPIHFFKEDTANSNMEALGLKLNTETGEISGLISHTGQFRVSVIGGDLLGSYTWTLSGEAGCRAGDYYNTEHAACEPCPIGTFRDQEAELQLCETHKPNSSTLSVGSTQLAQCQCIAGFEIGSLGACTPCPPGTYKAMVSDSHCTGKCPANMRSFVAGANSEEALHCLCDAGYFMEGDTCKPCPIGSYCTGDLSLPMKCPENQTTKSAVAKHATDCVCIPGFTLVDDECVKCSRLTYKSTAGDEPCTACPQPASFSDTGAILLASTKREEAEYTPDLGATQPQECRLCASGYFFDSASGGCMACSKNSFCPGGDLEPRSCADNSLTLYAGAETPFACKCPKGYGKVAERNPVDLTIVCVECPRDTFQHIEGTDTQCIPCPSATVTKSTKSTSFAACVASPGYFFPEKLEQILVGIGSAMEYSAANDEEGESAGVRTGSFTEWSIDSGSIRLAESKYELMTDELLSVPRICQSGDTLIQRASPEIKMQSHTENLESCIQACARNVYCTSLTFRHGRAVDPSFPVAITNHTGVYVVSRWPCELHFYGKELSESDLQTLRDAQQKDVDADVISCVLERPEGDNIWRRLMYQECPLNAYCPGDREAQIYECPSSSVTLAPRASTVDQCRCIPGYRAVAGQCEPCRIGTYKNTTSNLSCTECPSSFTTASVASISAYDCVCLPGLYMKMIDDLGEEMSSRGGTDNVIEDGETNDFSGRSDERHTMPEPSLPPNDEAEEDAEEDELEEEELEDKDDAHSHFSVRHIEQQDADMQEEEDNEEKQDAEPENARGEGALRDVGSSEDVANIGGTSTNTFDRSEVRKSQDMEKDVPQEDQSSRDNSPQSDGSLVLASKSDAGLSSMLQNRVKAKETTSDATPYTLPPLPDSLRLVDEEGKYDRTFGQTLQLLGNLITRPDLAGIPTLLPSHAVGRGGLAGVIFMPDESSSHLDGTRPKWMEPELREKLEKVVRLHQCTACYKQMYCPGLWLDPPFNRTHMPPQLCPVGSNVPSSTVIADSIEKCLCLPGYSYVGGGSDDKSVTMSCSKCAPGTYKELQENSPCAGRCMKDAETFEGAVAKIQCFCKVGKYAVESTGTDSLFTCQDCLEGGVCPGGFKKRVREGIELNHSFVNITIRDHQVPFPSKGFFAVYKESGELLWDPSLVPMSANFTGDTYLTEADMEDDLFRRNAIENASFLDMPVVQGSRETNTVQRATDSLNSHQRGLVPRKYVHSPHLKTHGTSLLSIEPSRVGEHMGMLQSGQKNDFETLQIAPTLRYERIPDIHACFEDRRCEGGPHNMCSRGSAGYLCSACEPGYSTTWYRSMCQSCLSLWLELLVFLVVRLVVCLVIWLLASLSIVASEQRELVHPILLRILLSNYFLFSIFGLIPETSVSVLFEWAPLYRTFFFSSYFCSHPYVKLACVLQDLGFSLEYRYAWYLQRVFQISVPFFDAVFITIVSVVAISLYKGTLAGRIQQIRAVLRHAQETRGSEFWTACTIRKIENDRCLGLFRYLTSESVFSWKGFKTLLADLIPAYTVIWFWHYPALVIQSSELVNCVTTSYKSESPLSVLSAMPMQTCKLNNMLFLGGFILGIAVLLLWGVGTIILLVVWVQHSQDSDPIQMRFRRSFLANGYQVQYRAWEAVLTVRKGLVAVTMAMHVHLNSAGAQEVFRSSANLALSVVYVMMQLIMEPYDKRSHNLANRVEFYGLLAHIANGVIIQGSYYFDAFKYIGPIPIVITSLFYLYVLWNLFVEWGRAVIMRPYLARIPSFWRYYNRVTRSLARLYTAENAKIYYNYITKDMVVEAAAKLRVFHIRRLLRHRGYESAYRKINYENRLYFVAALTDSLSQLVIAWCQFTIPGDWLDFTIRYAFCYCFWQRHQGAIKFRVPLDTEDFDSIKPDLFSDWYHKMDIIEVEDTDNELFEGKGYVCNQAEEELLQLMLDDDVYDDSPITLVELYVAVQSMRYIPQMQLRRLHFWYRERIANASNTVIPEIRKENEELKAEIEELNESLRQMTGAKEVPEGPSFSLMDFFFTVEMVQQARMEVARLQEQIEKSSEEITRERVAQAMANHLLIGLKKEEEEQAREEAVEQAREVSSLPIARPREAEQPTVEVAVLAAQQRRDRMDYLTRTDTEEALGRRKALRKRRLKLAERRLDRAETRRTLQRDFAKRRTLVGPGERPGGPLTLRRPGSGEGLPRRIVLAGETRQRSISPVEAAKRREKSLSLTKVDLSAFQASEKGPSFSTVDEEGSTELRRRTLTRRHLEEPRSPTLTSVGESERKRTVRLGSGSEVSSRRTLSLGTRGFLGESIDTTDAHSEGTTRRRLSSAAFTMRLDSPSGSRAARGKDFQDVAQGGKRRLSPIQLERRESEGLELYPSADASCAAPEKTDTTVMEPGDTRRSLASPKLYAHPPGDPASTSIEDVRKGRRFAAVAADTASRASGKEPEVRVRSFASPTMLSRDTEEDAGTSAERLAPRVSRRRLRSPSRDAPTASADSADTGQSGAVAEGDSSTTPADERTTSSEAGTTQRRRREDRSSSGSRPAGRTVSLGQAKDSDTGMKSSAGRSETPHKED